mmetsp:Transcript_55174/g.130533  ORF Transcript_55174/g.130533 Transcript_55174/m.130533 type:complete len:186 (-) Transcript_55174:143-700(-)
MAAFPERKWLFGAEGLQRADRGALITTAGQVEPTGQMEVHDGGARVKTEVTKEKKRQFLDAKAWEIAISPGKQFMMTAFMLWMMGSGVHIMSIIFTFYQLITPIKGIMGIGQVFKGLEDTARDLGADLILQKLVYVACQLGVLLFITHRFGSMGLLPTSASDWIGSMPIRPPAEFAAGGLPLSAF